MDISIFGLIYVYALAFIVLAVLTFQQIPITKRAVIAIIRMTVQLIAASIALKYIFNVNSIYLTTGVYLFMILFATYTAGVNSNLNKKGIFTILLSGIFVSSSLVLGVILLFAVRPTPWYDAQYLIPLAGMILGNSMNSSALALERFSSELKNSVATVENSLSLGATPFEAVLPYIRKGVQASVTPTITTMMGTGIVSIPGMMSGQILAGVSPTVAFKYQVIIMLGIFISLAINISIVLLRSYKLFFTKDLRLVK